MTDKLEPVRAYGIVSKGRLTGRTCGLYLPTGEQRDNVIPVVIVPMPENGEVSELYVYHRIMTRNRPSWDYYLTRRQVDHMLAQGKVTEADFRPVWVIDREVSE